MNRKIEILIESLIIIGIAFCAIRLMAVMKGEPKPSKPVVVSANDLVNHPWKYRGHFVVSSGVVKAIKVAENRSQSRLTGHTGFVPIFSTERKKVDTVYYFFLPKQGASEGIMISGYLPEGSTKIQAYVRRTGFSVGVWYLELKQRE